MDRQANAAWIGRAVVLARGRDLTADELPPALSGPSPRGTRPGSLIPGAPWREIEREAILRTLEIVDGSTSRAAAMLGISARKIQYRLKEYSGESQQPSPGADDASDEAPGQARRTED